MRTPPVSITVAALAAAFAGTSAAALNAPTVNRGEASVESFLDHLRADGNQLAGVSFADPSFATFEYHGGAVVLAGEDSGPDWTLAGGTTVAAALPPPTLISPFFSERRGPGTLSLTYRNLDPARRYAVQAGHGEPRGDFAGRYSNNEFVLDHNTVVPVPSFQLGNNVAGEDPPAPDDLALVTLEITGVSTLTYTMRGADGGTRVPSIALFQVRDITAATRVVRNTNASGEGSLRQAIADAAGGATVVFDPGVFNGEASDTIVLTSELLVTGQTVTVDAGNIPGGVTVSGNGVHRVFHVSTGGNLTLRGLTVADGRGENGGGIFVIGSGAVLRMENGTLRDNDAETGGGLAVFTPGAATLVNCTVTRNAADVFGGGIDVNSAGASATLIHCTVSGNTSPGGGGISIGAGACRLENCIVTGNSATNGPDINLETSDFTVLGNNVIGNNDTMVATFPAGNPNANGDHVNGPDGLNILADNGGPGMTFLPLPGGAAIDHGERLDTSPGLDQLGRRRSAATPDIGAVETDWNGGTSPTPPEGLTGFGNITTPVDTIVGSSTNSPFGEEVKLAIDDDTATKYLNFDRLNTGFELTPCVGPTRLVGLALTSANDAPGRDPATFVLLGAKTPGGGFAQVAIGIVPAFTARFQTRTLYFPAVSASYSSYRIVFPTVASAVADPLNNSMQIAEADLLGKATDPTPRITKFELNRIEGSTRIHDLVWVSEPNVNYRLRFSFDLETWTNVPLGARLPSGGAASHVEFNGFDPGVNLRIEKN